MRKEIKNGEIVRGRYLPQTTTTDLTVFPLSGNCKLKCRFLSQLNSSAIATRKKETLFQHRFCRPRPWLLPHLMESEANVNQRRFWYLTQGVGESARGTLGSRKMGGKSNRSSEWARMATFLYRCITAHVYTYEYLILIKCFLLSSFDSTALCFLGVQSFHIDWRGTRIPG